MERNTRLGATVLAGLDALPADERPYLSDISLWEVATLVAASRLALTVSLAEWLERAAHPRTVRILPITAEVAADVAILPAAFHRDPADRIIVATCRVMGLSIVTHDRPILQSRLVTRWKPRVT